jgi:hypothetical protein
LVALRSVALWWVFNRFPHLISLLWGTAACVFDARLQLPKDLCRLPLVEPVRERRAG